VYTLPSLSHPLDLLPVAGVRFQIVQAWFPANQSEDSPMVNHCANPLCGKPLHYLREGRVYLFSGCIPAAGAEEHPHVSHLQHFWLCGVCSLTMTLVQDAQTIRLVPRRDLLSSSEEGREKVPWEAL
jgi:hypothetical protein